VVLIHSERDEGPSHRPQEEEGKAMRFTRVLAAAAAAITIASGVAHAETTLRIGLAEDPDVLDPTLARTYVGRIVFASFCDKLFDIDEHLNVVPQLALS
jgi:peptide/nickel transport system substrate-binding protein